MLRYSTLISRLLIILKVLVLKKHRLLATLLNQQPEICLTHCLAVVAVKLTVAAMTAAVTMPEEPVAAVGQVAQAAVAVVVQVAPVTN